MANYTVDEFIIELGFNEKVIKGLQRVEKSAMASATRIENRLNKAVNIDGNKSKAGFDKIVRNANVAANNINRVFSKSVDFGSAGKSSIKSVETAARSSARRIKKDMQDAFNVRDRGGNRGGSGGPSGGGRPPIQGGGTDGSAARSIERTFSNNYYSGLTRKLESMGTRGQGLAGKFRSDITGLKDEALKAPAANLANYNMQIKQSIDSMKRWISAENAEAKARREQTWLLDRANSSLTQWIGGFASLYTAIEGIKKVVDAGVKRQGVTLSADAVFKGQSGDAKQFAATFAQDIGQGYTETLKQYTGFAAGAQNSMGYQGAQDFYKNAAIFGRVRGLDTEQMKGIMTAFTQMASKGRIQAEELRGQLGDRLPGSEQTFADALGLNTAQIDKLMKDGKLLAKDVLPLVSKQMKKLSDEVGGMDAVSKMAVTGIGRVNNAIESNLTKAFSSAEGGIGEFNNSLANMLNDNVAISEALGHVLGRAASMAGTGIDYVDSWGRQLSALFLRTSAWYDELTDGQKKLVDSTSDFLIGATAVLAVMRTVAALAAKLKWVSNLLGGSGTEAAETVVKKGGGKLLGRLLAPVAVYNAAEDAPLVKVQRGDADARGRLSDGSSKDPLIDSMKAQPGLLDALGELSSYVPRVMEWMHNNNLEASKNFNQNMLANPSMYNPIILPPVLNNQSLRINVNLDGRAIGEFNAQSISHANEDMTINAEHMGD